MSNASNKKTVLGFQFEPQREKNYSNSSDEEYNDSSGEEEVTSTGRLHQDVTDWCKCNCCALMPLEEENVCCRELEVSQLTELGSDGKTFLFISALGKMCVRVNPWF